MEFLHLFFPCMLVSRVDPTRGSWDIVGTTGPRGQCMGIPKLNNFNTSSALFLPKPWKEKGYEINWTCFHPFQYNEQTSLQHAASSWHIKLPHAARKAPGWCHLPKQDDAILSNPVFLLPLSLWQETTQGEKKITFCSLGKY